MTAAPATPRLRDERLAPGVSVVVPCFRSEANLEELVAQLHAVLQGRPGDYEVILVDDGSPDGTWPLIERLAAASPRVRGLQLMRNYGQHNATLCGTRAGRYSVIVTMDDDLQHPPAEIPRLLDKLAEGYDVVYGVPESMPHSPFRNMASWFSKHAVALATRQGQVREIAAFRAFRTSLRQAFAEHRGPQVLLDVLLGWGTTRIASVKVTHDPRRAGTSNYGLRDLLRAVLLLWTGYTTAPLRFASWLGLLFVLFGMAVLSYVVGVFFLEGSLPGFPFLASTIAIFGGVQLFALGIIGEYLARLFERSLDRPAYVVHERTGPDE